MLAVILSGYRCIRTGDIYLRYVQTTACFFVSASISFITSAPSQPLQGFGPLSRKYCTTLSIIGCWTWGNLSTVKLSVLPFMVRKNGNTSKIGKGFDYLHFYASALLKTGEYSKTLLIISQKTWANMLLSSRDWKRIRRPLLAPRVNTSRKF